jgi:hypothetical protein
LDAHGRNFVWPGRALFGYGEICMWSQQEDQELGLIIHKNNQILAEAKAMLQAGNEFFEANGLDRSQVLKREDLSEAELLIVDREIAALERDLSGDSGHTAGFAPKEQAPVSFKACAGRRLRNYI